MAIGDVAEAQARMHPRGKYPWIDAANDAGPLSDRALSFLSSILVPGPDGRVITLPEDTWQGMWRLMHMARSMCDAAPTDQPATK